MRTALVAAMALPLLIVSCLYCASPISQARLDRLGGDTWRVLDADEMDMLEGRAALRQLYARAVECAGVSKSFSSVKVFSTTRILRRTEMGWMDAVGLYVEDKIYVVRGLSPPITNQVVVHEYMHYLTDLPHPDIDPLLESCGIIVTLEKGKNG